MKLIYVCSPYRGNIEENVKKAQKYSRYVVEQKAVPLAPHLLFPQFVSEDNEREIAIDMNTVLLQRCDELWVFGSTYSNGMLCEIDEAKKLHKPIKYYTEDFRLREAEAEAERKEKLA